MRATPFDSQRHPLCALVLGALIVAGCHSNGGSGALTEAPKNWSDFEGRNVTVEGTAGNSRTGPFIRMGDKSVIHLDLRPWSIDTVSRPIGVKGKVTRGTGPNEGQFIIAVDSWWLQKSTNVPQKK
jgi:hypothetical protein